MTRINWRNWLTLSCHHLHPSTCRATIGRARGSSCQSSPVCSPLDAANFVRHSVSGVLKSRISFYAFSPGIRFKRNELSFLFVRPTKNEYFDNKDRSAFGKDKIQIVWINNIVHCMRSPRFWESLYFKWLCTVYGSRIFFRWLICLSAFAKPHYWLCCVS